MCPDRTPIVSSSGDWDFDPSAEKAKDLDWILKTYLSCASYRTVGLPLAKDSWLLKRHSLDDEAPAQPGAGNILLDLVGLRRWHRETAFYKPMPHSVSVLAPSGIGQSGADNASQTQTITVCGVELCIAW
jgi:hypothetical protein